MTAIRSSPSRPLLRRFVLQDRPAPRWGLAVLEDSQATDRCAALHCAARRAVRKKHGIFSSAGRASDGGRAPPRTRHVASAAEVLVATEQPEDRHREIQDTLKHVLSDVRAALRRLVKGEGRPSSVDVITWPYPGFPTDLQAQMVALLTVGDGRSLIREIHGAMLTGQSAKLLEIDERP